MAQWTNLLRFLKKCLNLTYFLMLTFDWLLKEMEIDIITLYACISNKYLIHRISYFMKQMLFFYIMAILVVFLTSIAYSLYLF